MENSLRFKQICYFSLAYRIIFDHH